METKLKQESKYEKWAINHPWWVILASLLVVVLTSMGAGRLVFNPDNRIFFNENNPELIAFENMEATYSGRDENILIVVAPKSGDVFTKESLALLDKYTERAWQVPFSSRVDSITNFQHSYSEGDDLIIKDLVGDSPALSQEAIADIKAVALDEPLLVKRLVSLSGHVAGINITLKKPGKDLSEVPSIVEAVRQIKADIIAEAPNHEVYLTGLVMLDNAFSEVSAADSANLMPITLLIFLLSIAILFKGWTGAFATLWVIVFSILSALGVAGWFGLELTAVSASAPTIIITLAIANAIHVLVGFNDSRREGAEKKPALVESVRVNFQPIFLVSSTTALGFLTMNFSESPPFHTLGNIVAVGVIFSFVFSMTFLPALMSVLPVKPPKPRAKSAKVMTGIAEFVIEHRNKILLGVGALIIGLGLMVPKNELNDEWVKYFDSSLDFRQDTDFTSDNLTGVYRIDYSLDSKTPDGISDPAFLEQVQAFTQWYREQKEVVQVTSLPSIIKRLHKNMHGDDASYAVIPDDRELIAQYILLYEMSLPYGLDLNNQISIDKAATRLTVTTHDLSVKQTLALEERAQEWLSANAPDLQAEGTGNSIMFAHIGMRSIKGMLLGTSLALLLISGILIVAFRSLKIGLISLIPNIAPGLMAFGLWGLLVGEVGMGLATVASMTMGIVVDDTVHFLSKYMRARRERGMNSEDAVRYAFSTVGTALWFTSFTLIAGFAVLAFSTFKMNGDMALLSAVTIGIALLADFLFLPALLLKLDRPAKDELPMRPQEPFIYAKTTAGSSLDHAAKA